LNELNFFVDQKIKKEAICILSFCFFLRNFPKLNMCAHILVDLIHASLIGKHVGSMAQDINEFVINKLYQQFILLSSCISFVDAQHFKVKKGN
jgi:hypothetical protein